MPVLDPSPLPSATPQREVVRITIDVAYEVVSSVLTPVYTLFVHGQRVLRNPTTLDELMRDPRMSNQRFADGQVAGLNRQACDRLVTVAETKI